MEGRESICSDAQNLKKKKQGEGLQLAGLVGKASMARLKSRCEQQYNFGNSSREVDGRVSIHSFELTT